jgi:hypothetical protein
VWKVTNIFGAGEFVLADADQYQSLIIAKVFVLILVNFLKNRISRAHPDIVNEYFTLIKIIELELGLDNRERIFLQMQLMVAGRGCLLD